MHPRDSNAADCARRHGGAGQRPLCRPGHLTRRRRESLALRRRMRLSGVRTHHMEPARRGASVGCALLPSRRSPRRRAATAARRRHPRRRRPPRPPLRRDAALAASDSRLIGACRVPRRPLHVSLTALASVVLVHAAAPQYAAFGAQVYVDSSGSVRPCSLECTVRPGGAAAAASCEGRCVLSSVASALLLLLLQNALHGALTYYTHWAFLGALAVCCVYAAARRGLEDGDDSPSPLAARSRRQRGGSGRTALWRRPGGRYPPRRRHSASLAAALLARTDPTRRRHGGPPSKGRRAN